MINYDDLLERAATDPVARDLLQKLMQEREYLHIQHMPSGIVVSRYRDNAIHCGPMLIMTPEDEHKAVNELITSAGKLFQNWTPAKLTQALHQRGVRVAGF